MSKGRRKIDTSRFDTLAFVTPDCLLSCGHIPKGWYVYRKTVIRQGTTPSGSNVYLTNLAYIYWNPTDSVFVSIRQEVSGQAPSCHPNYHPNCHPEPVEGDIKGILFYNAQRFYLFIFSAIASVSRRITSPSFVKYLTRYVAGQSFKERDSS